MVGIIEQISDTLAFAGRLSLFATTFAGSQRPAIWEGRVSRTQSSIATSHLLESSFEEVISGFDADQFLGVGEGVD